MAVEEERERGVTRQEIAEVTAEVPAVDLPVLLAVFLLGLAAAGLSLNFRRTALRPGVGRPK